MSEIILPLPCPPPQKKKKLGSRIPLEEIQNEKRILINLIDLGGGHSN